MRTPTSIADCGGGGGGGGSSIVNLINGELFPVPPGTPVYISANNTFKVARADALATMPVFGLTTETIDPGEEGPVQVDGLLELTTTEWDAITGAVGGLSANVTYYVSAAVAGGLTPTPPSLAGQFVQMVILAFSTTGALIRIQSAEEIGSGANLIRLSNDNASPILIGQPVFSSSPGGADLGIANNTGKGNIIGLVADTSIAAAADGDIAVGGVIVATTTQWDAVAGTAGGLAFNTVYYLDPAVAGRLTATAPVVAGQQVVQLIVALSATEARIAILPPVLL